MLATAAYVYDQFNRLIKRTVDADGAGSGAAADQFFAGFEGINPTLIFDGPNSGDLTNRLLWGDIVDELFADEQITNPTNAGNTLWAASDHLGTIRDLVDFNGTAYTVANHRVYDSFGNLTSETNGSVSSLFAFTGKLFDKDFKLSNHWNRWYDPAQGKWISEDPIGFAAGDANLGRYGANNPAKYIDPDGYDIVTPSNTNSTSQYGENDGLGYGADWTTPLSELDFIAGQQARQAEADRQARQWQELLENYHNDGGWWDNYWAAWQGETPRVDILDSGLYYGGKGSRIVGIGAGTAAAVITTGGGILAVGAPGTAVTSTSVLTAVGGGAVVAYEIDVGQAAIRSEIAGHQVDSLGGGLIQDALGRETKAGQVGSFVYDNLNLLNVFRGRGIRGDGVAPRWGVDNAMRAADEAAGVIVNGRYVTNPTAKNLAGLLTDSGKVGSKQMSGQFMYVVDDAGDIIIGTRAGQRMPHPTLVGGANPQVRAAGIVDIRGGRIYSVDNASGHFKPGSGSLGAAEEAFRRLLPQSAFHKDFQGFLPWNR